MMSAADRKPPATAFFGRRKGHRLRDRQAALMSDLLPRLTFDDKRFGSTPLQAFGAGIDRLRVEIGFGGGEHLLAEAAISPGTGFIGCEPYVNGMAKILGQIETRGLTNIRLYAGDALVLLSELSGASVARVDLIHPDPWPKRRHWKRRFVQDETIAQLARVLMPGGEFRFVSDIDGYCAWTLAHMLRARDFIWPAERADDWRKPWPGYTMTRYGAKATREGRQSNYLIFRRS